MTDHNAANLYDAIVVGARCAGSPTAMLLARRGYRTLVVDRARFPEKVRADCAVCPRRHACNEICVARYAAIAA